MLGKVSKSTANLMHMFIQCLKCAWNDTCPRAAGRLQGSSFSTVTATPRHQLGHLIGHIRKEDVPVEGFGQAQLEDAM